ncbi:metallophosphoesterase family protein [Helicobacter marmotae]|uniref:Calcineurin-like phosphoesterase domain-containing protein n=1 Tax=Helicobacter marmotae TaxID=152490 RepID=A0A3D8I2H1_9HELI|nr:hypothetical protein [Helicobacter marmotae]RDU58934.1 hypothetical protein CQA63_08725 [Helicobacter marmotae]
MSFDITQDTFVISDSHFGHKAVLKREPSRMQAAAANGYKDFYKFHRDKWNEVVGKKDNLLHLGDLYFVGGEAYLKSLKGSKALIVGNNDIKHFHKLKKWHIFKGLKLYIPQKEAILQALYKEFSKQTIKDDIYLNAIVQDIGTERIMFSHFPVFERKKYDRFATSRYMLDRLFILSDCSLNIHGHIHSRQSRHSFCFNVSCEHLGFTPKRLSEILRLYRYRAQI